MQKLDGELGIVLELALRLFPRPGGHELGIVLLDCSWPSSTWCWPKIGGGGRGDEKGEEGVRKLHSVHMTCAAPLILLIASLFGLLQSGNSFDWSF